MISNTLRKKIEAHAKRARERGAPISDNPYPTSHKLYEVWRIAYTVTFMVSGSTRHQRDVKRIINQKTKPETDIDY